MMWNLNPPSINETSNLGTLGGTIQPVESMIFLVHNCSIGKNNSNSATSCENGYRLRSEFPLWECPLENENRCRLWEEIPTVNVSWIWGLVIVMIAPAVYTAYVSSRNVCFKENDGVNAKFLIFGLLIESINTTVLCLLVFLVMPSFDPISASTLSNFICTALVILIIFLPIMSTTTKNDKHKMTREGDIKETKSREMESVEKKENRPKQNRMLMIHILGLIVYSVAIVFQVWYIYQNTAGNRKWDIILLFIFGFIFISLEWWENFVIRETLDSNKVDTTRTKLQDNKFDTGDSNPAKNTLDTDDSNSPKNVQNTDESQKNKSNVSVGSFLFEYIQTKRDANSIIISLWRAILTVALTLGIFCARTSESSMKTFMTLIYLKNTTRIKTFTGEVLLQSRSYIPYGCSSKDPILLALIAIGLGFLCFKSSRYACRTLLQRICFAPPLFLSLILVPLLLLAILSNPLFWTTKGCNIAQPIWQLNTGEPTEETVPLIVSSIMGLVSTILLTLYVWTNKGTKTTFSERMFIKPFYSGIFLDLSLLLSRRRSFEKEVKSKVNSEKQEFSASSEMDDRIQFHPVVFFCATMWHETEEEMTQLLKSIFRTDYRYFILETTRKTEDIFSFDVHIFFDDAFKPRKNGKKGIHVNEYVKQLEKLIPMTAKAIYDGCELQPVEKYKTPYGARYEWELLSKQKLVVHLKDSTKIRHKKRWSQVMYMYYLLSYKTNEMRKEMENDPKLQSKGPNERKDVLKSRMQKYTNNIYILALDGDVDFKPEAIDLLLDRMKKNPLVGAACGRIHPIGSGPMIWYQKFEYAISHWLQKATEHIIGCVLCSPGCFSLFRGSAILSDNVIKTYTRTSSEALHYIQRDQGDDRWLCTLLLKQGFRVEYCAASDALTFAPEGFFEFYKQRRRWTPSTMANIFDLLLDWRKVRKTNRNISIFYVCYQVILFVFSILTPGTIFMLILGTIITAFPSIEPWLALVLNLMPVTIFILSIYLTKEETQEFDCLFFGLLYFLAVPSMSMLLILYSIGNMHNINWGTRESNIATERTLTDEIKSKFEGQSCNIGDWCRCIIYAREIKEPNILENNENAENTEDMQSGHDTSIHVNIQNHIEDRGSENAVGMTNQDKLVEDFTNVLATSTAVKKTSQKDKGSKGIFKKCKPITPKEEKFWTDIIKKYLKPLKANKDKKKVQADLKDLRNKVFFFYFVINTAFVTLIFALTQINAYQGTLLIPLPCDTGGNQSTIEPISIACIVVFGILLTIQFFGMIYHRISTVTQIIATTTISEEKKSHPIVKIPSIEISEGILKEDTAQSPKKRKWVKVKAGMALKVLSGEKIKRPLTVDKLSESIRNQMPPSNNELKEMFKKFQNIPLIQSIRNTGHVYEDQTGPSSSFVLKNVINTFNKLCK